MEIKRQKIDKENMQKKIKKSESEYRKKRNENYLKL